MLHLVKGDEIRSILYVLEPGDILLRKWRGYLNAILTGGNYSHAGMYVGNNTVVHAMADGVIEEDILDFCRSDSICVLCIRNGDKRKAVRKIKKLVGAPYDYDFLPGNKKYYCTEIVSVCYDNIFANDYQCILGQSVLTPVAIRNSDQVECKLEILH